MYTTSAKISGSGRPICFFAIKYHKIQSCVVYPIPYERLMARRVRPDQRWDAGGGACGGQPGSTAMKGRSLAADQPCANRTFPGVRHNMTRAGGRSQAEERLGEAAAILRISRRRKAMYGGLFWILVQYNVCTRRRTSWEATLQH
jgi:hypothetical protein